MQTAQITPINGYGYSDQHLNVNFQDRSAQVDFRPVRLTNKEFELLEFLVRNAGGVVRSTVLLDEVFGYCPDAHTRTLHVHIRRLRKKLGLSRENYIETIFGVGYRFQPVPPAQVELT
jgi:DNA-binding response OmpR family regulator